jgi:hypothetical protein
VVTIDLRENVFSVSHELRFLKLFLRSGQCVFFVSCKLRLEKQLRSALFCVTMQHVVVIFYQFFEQWISLIMSFGFLTPKDGTDRMY